VFMVEVSVLNDSGLGFMVWGLGYMVRGSGLRVEG